MSETVIKVENLSKQYRIGAREGYKTFRETLVDAAKAPLRAFKKLSPQSVIRNPQSETIWALKDVSFEVKQGEVVGIIGRNGAGKSTLLKILSQITKPTEGRVKLKGRVGALLEVGTGFHHELTGHENIYLYGAILGMDRWEITRKFDEIVAFAGIEKFIDTPVKRYSSGMYMRLAFAVAAHLETEILIVDEVLAVGDAVFQKKCLTTMNAVSRKGRTVLFVSHNMRAILQLCQQGLLLDAGQITRGGSISECIAAYMSNGKDHNQPIISQINRQSSDLTIKAITVNGSGSNKVPLPSEDRIIEIEITGKITVKKRIDVEARISDLNGIPLAFFSPGHEKGYANFYPAGDFNIRRSFELPQITKGDFYLSLYLTDPGVETWLEVLNAVHLISEGISTRSGLVFDYNKGTGWVILSDMTK